MRKTSAGILPALLFAATAAAAEPAAAKSHAHTLAGTVAAVDDARNSLTVRDGKGKETLVSTTSATRVSGGRLEPGAKVTVRWVSRDHKNVATAVLVHASEAERTASVTPPTSVSPTPRVP